MLSFHKTLGAVMERSRIKKLVIYWQQQREKEVKESIQAFDIVRFFDGDVSQRSKEPKTRNPERGGIQLVWNVKCLQIYYMRIAKSH